MKYQTLFPITHNGQPLPVGLVFSETDSFGKEKEKRTPLEVETLLARKRIAPVTVLAPDPPKGEPQGKDEEKGKK